MDKANWSFSCNGKIFETTENKIWVTILHKLNVRNGINLEKIKKEA